MGNAFWVDDSISDVQIEIRCYGSIRTAVGEKYTMTTFETGTSVDDLLAELDERHDITDHTDGQLVVVRNGSHVDTDETDSVTLTDGDVISLSSRAMPE